LLLFSFALLEWGANVLRRVAGLYVDGVADGRFRRLGRDSGVQRSVRATRAVSTFLCMISTSRGVFDDEPERISAVSLTTF